MIIETRYRDVPWEEVIRCYKPPFNRQLPRSDWEQRLRGKPLRVITPPCFAIGYTCEGPFYKNADQWGDGGQSVCVHIAELGD